MVGEKPVSLLPGVGPETVERLGRIGIDGGRAGRRRPGDPGARSALAEGSAPCAPRQRHRRPRPQTERKRKSESRETTFPHDVTDPAVLLETVDELADSVCRSLASSMGIRVGQ